MLIAHLALVSEASRISSRELSVVAAALSKQVSRDFAPIWGVKADVVAFEKLEDLPVDYWPIIVKDDIGDPSAAGYHEDKHGQPFALVQYDRTWSLTASHEVLEMLGDPFGRRTVAGDSPVKGQGRVKFLVEVCDPVESTDFAYTINGVPVSDFYTPHFFDPEKSAGVRYSYTGALSAPRQVLKDGYLSWYVPTKYEWWQRTWFGGAKPADGPIQGLQLTGTNVRAAIDRVTAGHRAKLLTAAPAFAKLPPSDARRQAGKETSAAARAGELRETIKRVTKG